MKKTVYETMLTLIEGNDTAEANEVRDAINAELAKGKEKAEANRGLYEAAKAVVLDTLESTPVTIGELFEACEDRLPEGFTKSKLQYAVTRMWTAEIKKVEGKVNTYYKA